MPASNIKSVSLSGDKVTIVGEVTDIKDHDVELLHVWLAQPGPIGQNGAGLAIDCLAGTPPPYAAGKFTLTAGSGVPGVPGVVGAFVPGPATVSAIAVLSPKSGSSQDVVTEVMQWSHTVTVPKVW